MISFPFCKINLGLHILSRRSDGYHSIETCFYPVPWTDMLEVIPSKELIFTQTGISIPDEASGNLCVKAYHLLKKDFEIGPAQIHLHKIIPMGAGLGGGSSDAAFMLVLLNEVFSLRLTMDQLKVYASQLGSDCAFFLERKPLLGRGRGEELSDVAVDLKGKYLALIKPDISISTREAYSNVKPRQRSEGVKEIIEKCSLSQWREFLINDFEESVFIKYPAIKEIKEYFYSKGASYASMSGSGSSVLGIFDMPIDLMQDFKGKLYWSGLL